MKGYCEFTIQGEKVGLKFGLEAFKIFSIKASIFKLFDTTNRMYNETGLATILYAGYANNCLIKQELEKFIFEYLYEVIEDDMYVGSLREDVVNAVTVFSESRFVKKAIDDLKEVQEEDDTEKKNPKTKLNKTGKKSKASVMVN